MVPSYNFPIGTSQKDSAFRHIAEILEGFRGYASLEDLKAADAQVRRELAGQLSKTREDAEKARRIIERKTRLSCMLELSAMISDLEKAQIRLAQPPSPRIAACRTYRPGEDILGKLYRLDFQMLSDAENTYNLMQEFQRMGQEDLIRSNILKITMSARDLIACLDEKERLVNCMLEI